MLNLKKLAGDPVMQVAMDIGSDVALLAAAASQRDDELVAVIRRRINSRLDGLVTKAKKFPSHLVPEVADPCEIDSALPAKRLKRRTLGRAAR
jgi:hypothetical protein